MADTNNYSYFQTFIHSADHHIHPNNHHNTPTYHFQTLQTLDMISNHISQNPLHQIHQIQTIFIFKIQEFPTWIFEKVDLTTVFAKQSDNPEKSILQFLLVNSSFETMLCIL